LQSDVEDIPSQAPLSDEASERTALSFERRVVFVEDNPIFAE